MKRITLNREERAIERALLRSKYVNVKRSVLDKITQAIARHKKESRMTFTQRAKKIRLLILDVDGVLSDGKIVYDNRGHEIKSFDVQDGAGVVYWKRAGRRVVLVSSRVSAITAIRGRELGVDRVYQHPAGKLDAFRDICRRFKVAPSAICAIGDDLMDLPILRRVGLAVAVANAVPEVKRAAHVVTRRRGGYAAVRELIERLLKAQGLWSQILARYLD